MKQIIPCLVALAVLVMVPLSASAVAVDQEVLQDPALEQRARNLFKHYRCLVCQNQSIEDSNAELAKDLRMVIREQVQAQKSDADIRTYLVTRYGDWVLLSPPFKPLTMLLWLSPVLILLIGGMAIILRIRRSRAQKRPEAHALSTEDQALLDEWRAQRNSKP